MKERMIDYDGTGFKDYIFELLQAPDDMHLYLRFNNAPRDDLGMITKALKACSATIATIYLDRMDPWEGLAEVPFNHLVFNFCHINHCHWLRHIFEGNQRIRRLTFSHCTFHLQASEWFYAPHLTQFIIDGMSMGSLEFNTLVKNQPNLEELRVVGTALQLEENPKIKKISVKITKYNLLSLRNFTHVKELIATFHPSDPSDYELFFDILSDLSNLTYLQIHFIYFRAAYCPGLYASVFHEKAIQSLKLSFQNELVEVEEENQGHYRNIYVDHIMQSRTITDCYVTKSEAFTTKEIETHIRANKIRNQTLIGLCADIFNKIL